MSERKPVIPVHIDPSAADLPASLEAAYYGMNQAIVQNNSQFGSITQEEHLRKSQSDIAGTALKALEQSAAGEERTAVILGAGNCFDIPLPQLVSEFDRTTLIDVNTQQTEQALSSLPANLLGKVALIKADVSGAMKNYYDAFGQAMEEEDYRRFQEVASALIGRLDVVKSQVDFGEKYNFVCSQLLMTQLGSVPTTNLGELSAKKYGSNFLAEPDSAAELRDVIDRQILNIQKAHIGHLRNLTKDRGTVHFADTVAKIEGVTFCQC